MSSKLRLLVRQIHVMKGFRRTDMQQHLFIHHSERSPRRDSESAEINHFNSITINIEILRQTALKCVVKHEAVRTANLKDSIGKAQKVMIARAHFPKADFLRATDLRLFAAMLESLLAATFRRRVEGGSAWALNRDLWWRVCFRIQAEMINAAIDVICMLSELLCRAIEAVAFIGCRIASSNVSRRTGKHALVENMIKVTTVPTLHVSQCKVLAVHLQVTEIEQSCV